MSQAQRGELRVRRAVSSSGGLLPLSLSFFIFGFVSPESDEGGENAER
jgi:hypothetical protein